ncbi:MAG: geranylgeranylglyceryl/heptaprenylglyceryl phosphate synthase [Chitinophagales bacterium]|nr:geranylgeranylglyceryl/heptaprenylglyceryl phosphate synthase [Chitinophagales bacterium]
MKQPVYQSFLSAKNNRQKKFAMLIDPDRVSAESLVRIADAAQKAAVDFLFLGGSLVINNTFNECVYILKSCCEIPIIIFPAHAMQVQEDADAILFLSLISGRNPELLIGQHVIAAPLLRASSLEIIPTGYMLVDGGAPTTVSYISNTIPIPWDKDEIAVCTALAGEYLGLKILYLDTGSGALNSVSTSMVSKVSTATSVPLIAGGGIRSAEKAYDLCQAGADIIVAGNAIEKDFALIGKLSNAVHAAVSV